ncbi:MAG TPA: GTPase HflX [Candidatus Nitrosocosmicus sp.]|nr:GTPase HflX [Candidatus Nitrosocosmicus sp.]
MKHNNKTILVTYPDDFIISEAKSLVSSIPEYEIIKVFKQKYLNRAKYGMGSGKAQEIEEFVKESKDIETIIVDEHLSSKQIFNLEQLLGIKVIDRERLILDIFYSRATTIEAKLQIQLAEIQYQMPRVRDKAKLMSKSNERAGKGGMGEYIVDVQFRDLKRQMSFIKEKIKNAQLKRQVYHQQRLKMGTTIVSLVGYTSSGKTTLFNLLTGEDKETSASLFTTLSTTTRSLNAPNKNNTNNKHDSNVDILIVDTVGFISRLPHYMIDAFKSTLEESLAADLILLLIDCSEDLNNIKIKYSSCWKVLEELKVNKSRVSVVLSKADKVTSDAIKKIYEQLDIDTNTNNVIISSKTGYGIHKLKNTLMSKQYIKNESERISSVH